MADVYQSFFSCNCHHVCVLQVMSVALPVLSPPQGQSWFSIRCHLRRPQKSQRSSSLPVMRKAVVHRDGVLPTQWSRGGRRRHGYSTGVDRGGASALCSFCLDRLRGHERVLRETNEIRNSFRLYFVAWWINRKRTILNERKVARRGRRQAASPARSELHGTWPKQLTCIS
jgi:hypothetical protein